MKNIWTHIRAACHTFHGLDKALTDRKIYPFSYFNTFRLHSWNERRQKQRSVKPLMCSYCGDDLSENGNGEYYSGYVIFEDPETIKICCGYFEKDMFNSCRGGANGNYSYNFVPKGVKIAKEFDGEYTLITKQRIADIITEILNSQPNYQLSLF